MLRGTEGRETINKVTSKARYFNLLLRKLRSPHTRISSQRSPTAFCLHFHQCSSLNIQDVMELKGRRAWKDPHKPLRRLLYTRYPQNWTHNQNTLAKEQAHGRQQHRSRDMHHCIGGDTREEGNLFGIISSAVTAKNMLQKSFPYIRWNSSPGSLHLVLFFLLQVGFHLVTKFPTFYIARMNLSYLRY